VIVIKQNSAGGAIHIFILAGPERPQEASEAQCAQEQRNRYQTEKDGHDSLRRLSRRAFAITRIDEDDIASAAMNGVT